MRASVEHVVREAALLSDRFRSSRVSLGIVLTLSLVSVSEAVARSDSACLVAHR